MKEALIKKQNQRVVFMGKEISFSLDNLASLFFAAAFFMPDYFGIKLGAAINFERIFMGIAILFILKNSERRKLLIKTILENRDIWFFLAFMFVCFYTMVYRFSIRSLLNPMIDMYAVFFLTIFFMKLGYSKDKLLDIINKCAWILSILGLFEAITHINIFSYFITIPGIGGGGGFRDGFYRIGGNGVHPLGYGLYLLLLLPLTCYNKKTRKIDITNNPVLVILLLINIYATGSRSTLGLAIIEIVCIVLLSSREYIKKALFIIIPLVCIAMLGLLLFYQTDMVQKIFIRVFTTIDGAFGTNLAWSILKYHSDILKGSADYRGHLVKIFAIEWLNPLVGRGVGATFSTVIDGYVVRSLDNYYVVLFFEYAYPGLITFILLCFSQMRYILRGIFTRKDELYRALLICFAAYFINLWFVDSLGTLDYIFVLFGLSYSLINYKTEYLDIGKEKV